MHRFDTHVGPIALRIAVFNELSSRTSTLWFERPLVRLGRAPEADLVLDNGYVSNLHGAIGFVGGKPHVMQLGTSNKLQVDGRPLATGELSQLLGSEVVYVRPFRLTIRAVAANDIAADVIHDEHVKRGIKPAAMPAATPPTAKSIPQAARAGYQLGQRFGINSDDPAEAARVAQRADALLELLLEHVVIVERARMSFRDSIRLPPSDALAADAHEPPTAAARSLALQLLAAPDQVAFERLPRALGAARRHQLALVEGMMAAVRALLEQLSPEAIERREAQSRSLLSAKGLWRAFARIHGDLVDGGHHLFSTLFGSHFSGAYAKLADAEGGDDRQ